MKWQKYKLHFEFSKCIFKDVNEHCKRITKKSLLRNLAKNVKFPKIILNFVFENIDLLNFHAKNIIFECISNKLPKKNSSVLSKFLSKILHKIMTKLSEINQSYLIFSFDKEIYFVYVFLIINFPWNEKKKNFFFQLSL